MAVFQNPHGAAKSVAYAVQGDDQRVRKTAAAGGGFGMSLVVIDQVQIIIVEAQGL